MKNILIIGAGLSATSLIQYLLKHSENNNWKITVGDMSLESAQKKINNHPNGIALRFNLKDLEQRTEEISAADIVVSMVPASMHVIVAKECLRHGKHLLTPSYVSPEMMELDEEAKEKGLSFLNELGVDPGLDHMSAMKIINRIKERGGKIETFKSFCGGLVAPDCDSNPWNYKLSWNPRNVVLAGQGTAQFKENGHYKYIPYHKLFSTLTKTQISGYDDFEVYPNRDSLQYCDLYGLKDIPTIMRGTMRRPGYCEAWDVLVQLGCTDDTYEMKGSHKLTYLDYLLSFLPDSEKSVEENLADFTKIGTNSIIMNKLKWLGLFSDEIVGLKNATPALILQKILEQKWALEPSDRDLLVMQHLFDFEVNGKKKRIISSMTFEGSDRENTAMSYTVGTPLAIATKLLAKDQINLKGVQIPISPELYEPILAELENLGIQFIEEEIDL
ncbi:saccharopine dehydrogenase C-terminal domain-containing protein [Labilibaculum antarcticum]|uniref:Saccharopine dehydrogenase n=1 Tax=Labilibaculum antarcticum TaxID=1717717 RepID=A0A1Y1CKE1_9BACT|nr:saccharopine dehydrogenase C-terminal domain-containing protein [Labilibaculum antarcticum]BAX80452.1 saccharopine dehydrogenase [Labilibaculum antarcticum]